MAVLRREEVPFLLQITYAFQLNRRMFQPTVTSARLTTTHLKPTSFAAAVA